MRAAVYLDQAFWSKDGEVYAARSFVLFLGKLAEHFDELTVAARLSPEPSGSHYRLPPPARFAALPHYGSAARPLDVIRAARESAARFAELLDEVDVVWLLGPHPFALLFARMAARRGNRCQGSRRGIRALHRPRRGARPAHRYRPGTVAAAERVRAAAG